MELPLTAYQRQLAEQRIMFDHPLASDLEEALRRASLACAENGKKETGLIEFFCGLYLHYRKEVSDHFNGDFDAVLTRTFPKHRYGVEGLVPNAILEKAATDDESGGFSYSVKHRNHRATRTVLRDQTWNRFWNRLSPKELQSHLCAPPKSLKVHRCHLLCSGC